MTFKRIDPGKMYRFGKSGVIDTDERVDDAKFWICRRVADFGPGQIPLLAKYATCADCGERIVYGGGTQHPKNAKKVCMQCMDIEPMPL